VAQADVRPFHRGSNHGRERLGTIKDQAIVLAIYSNIPLSEIWSFYMAVRLMLPLRPLADEKWSMEFNLHGRLSSHYLLLQVQN
jgi:hypothetical protein